MEPVNFGKVWGCKCTLCNPSSAPEEYAIIDSCLSKSYYHKFHQQWGSNPRKLTVYIKILIKLGARYDLLLIEALKKPVVTCIKPPSPPQTVLDWLLAQRKAIYSGSDGTWFYLGSYKKVYQKSCHFFFLPCKILELLRLCWFLCILCSYALKSLKLNFVYKWTHHCRTFFIAYLYESFEVHNLHIW